MFAITDRLTPEQHEELRRLDSAPTLFSRLYELFPRASAKELAEACAALGRAVSRPTAKGWRDSLVRGEQIDLPQVAASEEERGTTLDQAMRRLDTAVATGDSVGAGRWAMVLSRLKDVGSGVVGEDAGDGFDYSRLSDTEFRVLAALLDKAAGSPLTEDQVADVEWVQGTPDWSAGPHPAHVPLPPLAVEAAPAEPAPSPEPTAPPAPTYVSAFAARAKHPGPARTV